MNKNIISIFFKFLQKHVSFIFLFMLLSCSAFANNITVTNVSTTGLNTEGALANHYTMVQFNLSWENSWRISTDASNWDAAWVFVKYSVAGGAWNHATLSSNAYSTWTANATSSGTTINVSSTTGIYIGMPVSVTSGTGNFNYVSSAGATSSGTTITVTSTTGLSVGMTVIVTAGTGVFPAGTTVISKTGTTFVVSAAPTTALSGGATVVTGSGTVVTAIPTSTTFTVSAAPTTALTNGAIVTGIPTGSAITPASDGTGAFIYRSANGTGTNPFTKTQLRWNYGADGVADGATVAIKVFAIEMVYVPGGANFYVGSGGTEASAFYKYPTTTNEYPISSEGEITVGTATNNLYYPLYSGGDPGDQSGPIPAAFPKGYNAFYCMKYEISQQEYVDFLNTLTYTQQATRTPSGVPPSSSVGTYLLNLNRNKIKIKTRGTSSNVPASYETDYSYVACNYLSWADLAAYLDWSGLRPMTELEFEKSCRGTVTPTANEYAWGSISKTQNTSITNSGAYNETGTNNVNCTYGNHPSVPKPMRVGAFAKSSSTTSVLSGATYYGIMEMSGNLWERPVTVGRPECRTFTGTHGNGLLNASGNSDASTWPGTNAVGAGFRGGNWNGSADYLRVSDRILAAYTGPNRDILFGGRGVRTAP